IQRTAPRGRRVTGTGQGHRVGTATLVQVAFQLGQNGPLEVAVAGSLGPAVLGTALAALRLQYLDLTGSGLDARLNTDAQAQFLSVGAAVLAHRRRQAPYQRVVRVHGKAQPAGFQLTESSGLPGDRHTVVAEELTHPRPHGRGAMLGQQPAFTAVLLHRVFTVLDTCCHALRTRHLVLACAAGADLAGYWQQ